MLVVLVFNVGVVQTGFVYNSLKTCLAAENIVRTQWAQIFAEYATKSEQWNYVAKQNTPATCVPYLGPSLVVAPLAPPPPK
jgi:hypothetical protein